jgi:hypothetical protein
MAGVQVSIGADSRKAAKELKSFEKKTQSIAKSIAKGFKERIGHKLLDGLSSAVRDIPQMISTAVTAASDLNEEVSKSQVIFGQASDDIRAFAQNAVESMGLSEVAAMTATGTFGNLFKTMGMGQQEAANMSKAMTQLAADLGSFHNTTTEDAIGAIGAALRGESEPIRRYGVLLDDATLKAEALSQGLYDGVGALSPATKALAAYSVILKQTGDAQGDFARTSDGLAGQKKILQAQFDDLTVAVGQAFLPVIKDAVTAINDFDFEGIAEHIQFAIDGFGSFASAVADSSEQLQALINLVPGLKALSLLGDLFPETVERKVPEIETPDFLKPEKPPEMSEEERIEKEFGEEADKAWEAEKKFREEQARMQKEHDERAKAAIHAERERLEILEKQRQEKEKALALEKAQEGIDRTMGQVGEIQSSLNAAMTRSSITAVSSMQAIGGGGGVSGELNLQKTQTDLQRQLVVLNKELVDAFREQAQLSKQPVSQ